MNFTFLNGFPTLKMIHSLAKARNKAGSAEAERGDLVSSLPLVDI